MARVAAPLKGKSLDEAVQWGAAHGTLVQETPSDITLVDEEVVLAEVKRAMFPSTKAGGGLKAQR
jgi:hypothetical protein